MNINEIKNEIIKMGASNVGFVEVSKIPFEEEFRRMCEMNSCGMYGRSWMCPPDIGDIKELIGKAKAYDYAIVYNTISKIEDSFDIEGMLSSGKRHNKLSSQINNMIKTNDLYNALHLAAGGCNVCSECSKLRNEPCALPDQAMSSLEAYGISVSELASLCDMNYINGENTVTYFSALLLMKSELINHE